MLCCNFFVIFAGSMLQCMICAHCCDQTEPFIRAVAARHAQREDAEEEELGQALGQQQVRRYHLSTVYREAPSSEVYAQSQFGHPREVSSAVVQFFWSATNVECARMGSRMLAKLQAPPTIGEQPPGAL
eukprot:g30989.t1